MKLMEMVRIHRLQMVVKLKLLDDLLGELDHLQQLSDKLAIPFKTVDLDVDPTETTRKNQRQWHFSHFPANLRFPII